MSGDVLVDTGEATARAEWRKGWPLVLTSALGLSLATLAVGAIGLFFGPLESEFGWKRAEIAFGLTVYALVAVPLTPFFGIVIDKFGARRVAIPGIVIFGSAFASLSFTTSALFSWWGLWVILALASLGVKPTLWTMAVSSRFAKARGIALAAALCGTAIGSGFSPPIARWLIDVAGWRLAYVYMGLGWAAVVLVMVLLFFYDSRDRKRVDLKAAGEAPKPNLVLPGLTFTQAIKTRAFPTLATISFMGSLPLVAASVHMIPMLTMRGLTTGVAAGVIGAASVFSILGKLGTGWLFDRMDARRITAICLALPVIPLTILLLAPENGAAVIPLWLALCAVAILGFAGGAEISSIAYLTTRYVGLRSFAQNYGVMSAIMAGTTGIGPLIGGLIYDSSKSYHLMLIGSIPIVLVAAFLVLTLGPFPVWQADEKS